MYGKIENNNVIISQSVSLQNGGVIYNPTPEQWDDNGYFEIIDNRPEEIDGYYQQSTFAVVDNQIVYTYNYIINPAQDVNV